MLVNLPNYFSHELLKKILLVMWIPREMRLLYLYSMYKKIVHYKSLKQEGIQLL